MLAARCVGGTALQDCFFISRNRRDEYTIRVTHRSVMALYMPCAPLGSRHGPITNRTDRLLHSMGCSSLLRTEPAADRFASGNRAGGHDSLLPGFNAGIGKTAG